MSVRLKIVSIVIVTITLFGATIYFVGSRVLIKNYLEIEREGVTRDLERVNDAIANTYTQLDVKIADWATWDDSYKFIRDKNKAYIKSNLTSIALKNLKIQGMYFYDTKGKLIYSNVLADDTVSSKSVEMYFSSHPDIITHNSLDSSKIGLISLPEGNLLVASKPILTSEGTGPIRGTLIFTKQFDKNEIKRLSDLTHVPIDIFPYDSLQDDIVDAKNNLSLKNKQFVNVHSKDVIDGYSVLLDVNGSPVAIVEVESLRTIFNQGQQTTFTFMMIAGVFVAIFGIFLIFMIEKLVILRLTRLGSQAKDIGQSNDLSKKISMGGNDEISKLAQSINKMLEALKNSNDAKEEALSKNKETGIKLEEHIEELEKFNTLMVGRELRMIELKEALRQASFDKSHDKKVEKAHSQAGQLKVHDTKRKKKLTKKEKK